MQATHVPAYLRCRFAHPFIPSRHSGHSVRPLRTSPIIVILRPVLWCSTQNDDDRVCVDYSLKCSHSRPEASSKVRVPYFSTLGGHRSKYVGWYIGGGSGLGCQPPPSAPPSPPQIDFPHYANAPEQLVIIEIMAEFAAPREQCAAEDHGNSVQCAPGLRRRAANKSPRVSEVFSLSRHVLPIAGCVYPNTARCCP